MIILKISIILYHHWYFYYCNKYQLVCTVPLLVQQYYVLELFLPSAIQSPRAEMGFCFSLFELDDGSVHLSSSLYAD